MTNIARDTSSAVLVIDVGTSGLRAALVDDGGNLVDYHHVAQTPSTPSPGLVEFDAMQMYRATVEAAGIVIQRNSQLRISALGIANQRASVVAWDARTGEPTGPAIGWQDLRTVIECITVKSEHGLSIAPNQTATKAAWLMSNHAANTPPDALRLGTIDAWLTWKLSGGAAFITDHTNAAVTGLVDVQTVDWSPQVCAIFGVPIECLPRVVASREVVGHITGHPGLDGIELAARIGDQQSSLVGQGCIAPGRTKITFGTGGMLDMYTGAVGPTEAVRTRHGTFPIVAFSLDGDSRRIHWGTEAVMLSAGTNVEWLCTDMGLIASPQQSDEIARSVADTAGVSYVPALLGLGTPDWDYGARGTLTGLTRGTSRAHIVRAVLEGIAHRGADLLDAAVAEAIARGVPAPTSLRVDGGMSQNATFVQMLADTTGKAVEVSPFAEATTLGAAFLAGSALDTDAIWSSLDEATATAVPATRVTPSTDTTTRAAARAEWALTLATSRAWIPDLTALDF
jgi:glycerol kinase